MCFKIAVCLSLSLSLIKYISIFSVAVLFLVSWLPNLHKFSVFFVRWFWAPFFEQIVHALGVLAIPSGSDVLPVVKRHFRLFDQVFEAIDLAILCSA